MKAEERCSCGCGEAATNLVAVKNEAGKLAFVRRCCDRSAATLREVAEKAGTTERLKVTPIAPPRDDFHKMAKP